MENGHSYPSQYAWHFGKRTNHPATQHEVVDELRRRYASDWPTIWGTIWPPVRRAWSLCCGHWMWRSRSQR